MWKIDKDRIAEEGEESRVDTTGSPWNLVRFRMLDDDGEVYYEGVLEDDPECLNQEHALNWAAVDAGCTTIQVQKVTHLGREWVTEIG